MSTKSQADSISASIRSLTHEKKKIATVVDDQGYPLLVAKGLGQCVPEISTSRIDGIDFCSKWVFSDAKDATTVWMCRDGRKLLLTRNHYTGNNAWIRARPELHAAAIRAGFESEKVSRVVEDILYLRCPIDIDLELAKKISERVRYSFSGEKDYRFEEQYNERLGVSLCTVYDMILGNSLNVDTPPSLPNKDWPTTELVSQIRIKLDPSGKPKARKSKKKLGRPRIRPQRQPRLVDVPHPYLQTVDDVPQRYTLWDNPLADALE